VVEVEASKVLSSKQNSKSPEKKVESREGRSLSVATLTPAQLADMSQLTDSDIYELYEELVEERDNFRCLDEPSDTTPEQRREIVEAEAEKALEATSS